MLWLDSDSYFTGGSDLELVEPLRCGVKTKETDRAALCDRCE